MTGSTQTLPYTSLGPIRLPPGNLEPVEELPGDSDLEDEGSEVSADFVSDVGLSNVDEEEDDEDRGSLLERDPVFEKIKETLSKTQGRSESVASAFSSISDTSDGHHVQISDQYTSVPYGIQPRATYEHSSLHADIMGVAYNGRMRQFVILDSKGITTWKRDLVDPRVRRALQFPKYEYRLIMNIVYAPKYNCYFALGKDFSVKVLNRDFEETCSVHTDMRSVLYILFNPIRDELITGGVGGIKIWQFQQAAGKAFTELKPLANYELRLKETLPNVGGSWVKRVDLDYNLQHLYCCSDTDLHVYDLSGKLLFKFERAHTMSITGCCFSMSAKVLITSSVDSEVKVWSLTGGLVHTFRGHSRAVTGLLLHPETSSIIITASLDGSIRMWSLETMDLLYMIVVSADGVMWMGLTDDKLLYISTCRNITLWHLNNFCTFWSLARNQVSHLSLASCEEKTTRVLAVGDDSSVRMFTRSNRKNITTVLPPPDISPLQKVLSVCYSREKNAAFLLITNREIWVYTTRTDPSCRIAKWDVHDLQMPYISGDTSNLPPGVVIQPPSQSMSTHRATENGHGNEMISNCCSLCILNSTAMMWTDEGLSCPIRHTYLLLGMEDGRILFMDPVIKGQKYMEFKASKDSIQDMRHDVAHSCLITVCRLKTLVMIQIWGLPQLDAMYELYCGPDITCYARVGLSFLTGHSSGQINHYFLEQVEDLGMVKSKQEPSYESVVDENRRPEHQAPLVAMDSLHTLGLFVTCSSDGAIKVWDDGKVLMTEVMLEESLSTACFLNEMGDLLVGFKNHIFYIDHSKLCPAFKPPEIELETSDQESDVYEDPRVLYELIKQDEEPVTIDNYLVPYDHIEFDKDFLEGKTKIEQPKTAAEAAEISESETETDISLAPSSIYLSPAESIESLSMIDLTLGADYSKHDLRKQMKTTLDYMVAKGSSQLTMAARLYNNTTCMKRRKHVSIETPGQSDLEEKELESEVEKFTLPAFGESPGGSPSITPPSGQASPRQRGQHSTYEEYEDMSEEERSYKKPSGFVPVQPEQGILAQSPTPSEHGSAFTQTLSPVSVTPKNISSSPTISDRQIHKPTPVKHKPSKQDQNVQQSNSFQSKPQSVQFQKDSQSQGRTFPVLKTFGPVPVSKPSGQSVQTGRPGQSNLEKSQQQRSSFSLESTTQSKKHPISTSLAHKGTGAEIKGQMKIDSSNIKTQSPSQTASQKQQTTPKSNLKLLNSATDQTPPSPSEKTKPGISNPIRVSLSESGEFSKVLQALLEAESDESEEDIEKVPDKLETKSVTSDTDETKEFVAETDSKSDAQSDKDSGLAASMVTLSHRMDSELQSIPDSLVTVETVETGPENLTHTEIIKKSELKDTDTETSKPQDSSLQDTQKHTDGKWEPSLMENDETMISISSEVTSSGGRIEEPQAVYGDMDDKQEAPGPRRLKGMKVDVRGLMKKRRITSARAPSLTRRSSTDHSHDDHDHDHDHDHTHDDKRSKRDLKKKQPMDNRKMPPRLDKNKLLNMPPNPPSMLSRKRSLSEQRKSLELNLLHHPDFRRDHHHLNQNDMEEANMPHIQFGDPDMDTLQDQQWAQEASVLGTTLTLPPQRDKNKARLQNQPGKTDLRSQRLRDRKFGDKDPVEGQTPGVGSSPTAELEDDKMEVDKEQSPTAKDKDAAGNENAAEGGLSAQTKDGKDREVDSLINPDTNIPETQMQRAQRLGLKVDADKVFDNEKAEKTDGLPKALVRKSQKISIYIPQAEQEMPTSAKSSRRGTPDSGIDDSLSTPGRQTPFVPVIKLPDEDELNKNKQEEDINKDESLLTDEDKANAIRRPASSFTGLRRGQLEGERLRAERPHTAHVRFKAELEFIVELPDHLEDLQSAFEDALKKYQTLPGTPSIVSPEKLYKNDGIAFEDNWQERVIERHTLLRMQKEIRAQSAAQRRQAIEMIQKDKQSTKLFTSRCDSAIGGMSQTESSLHTSRRATTSMSVPITLGYGVGNSAPPPTRDKHRPKTANPVMEKQQMMKNELSQEKPFRYRLSKGGPQVSRPASSRSISTVGDFSPHWIDPRNPDAWRPKSSRSIPSKCNRYVLVNKPKEKPAAPVPSPLEEQLLVERFPRMGQKLVHTLPLPEPSSARMKQTYGMEYSPFIYQRYV